MDNKNVSSSIWIRCNSPKGSDVKYPTGKWY